MLWDIDTNDWLLPGAEAIAGRVLGRVRSGDVILMHDGGGNRSQTVAALEQVLATLSASGYRFHALCRSYPGRALHCRSSATVMRPAKSLR